MSRPAPSEGHGIVGRASWLLAGRVAGDAGQFVYYLLLAHTFQAAGVGNYSFAFAIAAFAILVVEFGLRDLLVRRIARAPDEASEIAASVVLTQAALSLALLAPLVLGARLLGYSPTLVTYMVLAFVALSLYVIGVTFTAFLEGVGAMHLSALAGVIQKAVLVVVGVGLILGGAGLGMVMGAHVAAGAAYLGAAWWWARRRFGSFRMSYRPDVARKLFLAALPLLATSALWEIYSRIDIVMLHAFRGDLETGLYAAAYKLISAPLFVAELVGVAAFPTLVGASAGNWEERNRVFRETLRTLAILGLGGGVVLFTAGDHLQVLLFGPGFARSGDLVRLMAPLFAIEFFMVPLWRLLLAMDRERTLMWLRAGSVALNVALNFVLIPRFGAMGAILTSSISEGLLALAQLGLCLRVVPSPLGGRGLVLGLVGALAAGAGVVVRNLLPWPLAAIVAAIVFAGLTFGTGLVRPAEVAEVWRQARLVRTEGAGGRHDTGE